MFDPARARSVGFFAGVALFLGAAGADGAGLLQLRLLLWIGAGVAAGPALLHALVFGLPPAPPAPRRARAQVGEVVTAAPALPPAGPPVLPAAPSRAQLARADRGGRPPAPHPTRQLTS